MAMDRWTWALLVPAPAQKVAPLVDAARVARYGEDDDGPPWQVRKGSGVYSVVIDREPGSEGSDHELAVELSRTISGTHYLLRFRDEAEAGWSYEGGRRVAELRESPWEVARRHGVDVPELPPLRPVRATLIVENATPDAVAKAIGLPGVPEGGPLSIVADGDRVLLRSASGNVSILSHGIAAATRGRVYSVTLGPDPGRIAVLVLEGRKVKGMFDLPETPHGFPRLDDIGGERTIEGVLRVLALRDE
jgi:hypothetical protein